MNGVPISRIAQARIMPPEQPALFPSPPEAVCELLAAGGSGHLAKTRTWRIGQVHRAGEHLVTRLGYETQEDSDVFDQKTGDFRHEAVRRGRTARFAVRLADLAVVHERRRGGISDDDFRSGLQRVLRASDTRRKWSVAPVDSKTSFDEWVHDLETVQQFRYRAEVPASSGSALLDALFEAGSGRVSISVRSAHGLDAGTSIFRELLQAAGRGVGEVSAVGRRKRGERRAWQSTRSAEQVVQEVETDPETGEVGETILVDVLAAVPLDPPW